MGYVSGEFQLIECGAGSGTLIVDILRAMHQMTADACIVSDLCMIEQRCASQSLLCAQHAVIR
jgi:SAM-dependent MidA family methyltransferase